MEKEENKLFEPNNDKILFKEVIEVYENCAAMKVVTEDDKAAKVSYYDLVGVLETQKQHIIWCQREQNIKHGAKKPKTKKVK